MSVNNVLNWKEYRNCYYCLEDIKDDENVHLEVFVTIGHKKCSEENPGLNYKPIYEGTLTEIHKVYETLHEMLKDKVRETKFKNK